MPVQEGIGGRAERTGAMPKFYLKTLLPKSGIEILFGPVKSEEILGYYYDKLASYIKAGGEIDSIALKDPAVAKLKIPVYSMDTWDEWRDAYMEGKVPSGRVEN